jgi:hypothetical protein
MPQLHMWTFRAPIMTAASLGRDPGARGGIWITVDRHLFVVSVP